MKKPSYLKPLFLLLMPAYLTAQVPVVQKNVEITPLKLTDYGMAGMEGSPWVTPISVVGSGWRSIYFATNYTTKFQTMSSFADESLSTLDMFANWGDAAIVSAPLTWWYGDPHGRPGIDGAYFSPSSAHVLDPALQFRRNYSGICSAHEIHNATEGDVILAFSHNENKNETEGGYFYTNTIDPSQKINPADHTTFSGYYNGSYVEDGNAYFAFTCMQWIQNTSSTDWGNQYFWEEGPVIWPATGYITNSAAFKPNTHGHQAPSSIISSDGYVYVFCSERGALPGQPDCSIKVVRALVSESLDPTKYWAYCNGSWQHSLPVGVTGSNMMSHLSDLGPPSSGLFPVSGYSQFTVAHLKGTNYYIGLEWSIAGPCALYLRSSTDLVHWSARTANLLGPNGEAYDGNMHFNGPLLLSADGMSNNEIDASHFYIIGSNLGYGHTVYRRRMSVTIPTLPSGGGPYYSRHVAGSPSDLSESNAGSVQILRQPDGISVSFPLDESPGQKIIHVYDLLGKSIKKEVIAPDNNFFKVDISDITQPGMYIFVIENNGEAHHLKFMVN